MKGFENVNTVGGGARAFSLLQHLAVGNEALDRRVLLYADRVLEGHGSLMINSSQNMHHYMYDFAFSNRHIQFGDFELSFGLIGDDTLQGAVYPHSTAKMVFYVKTPFSSGQEYSVAGTRHKNDLIDRFFLA